METKDFQKMLDGQAQQIERYMGVLKEDFESQLKGVADAVVMTRDVLEKRLDTHTEMIGNLMEDMAVVKSDVSNLKEDMAVVKSDVSNLMEDMAIVKADVASLTEDMAVVKSDVGDIKDEIKRKVDYEEFVSLKTKFEKAMA
ncbi:MAG: hypothetical protein Q7K40_04825 [bacterium]|nr:hypothetical protein [bacterium]